MTVSKLLFKPKTWRAKRVIWETNTETVRIESTKKTKTFKLSKTGHLNLMSTGHMPRLLNLCKPPQKKHYKFCLYTHNSGRSRIYFEDKNKIMEKWKTMASRLLGHDTESNLTTSIDLFIHVSNATCSFLTSFVLFVF